MLGLAAQMPFTKTVRGITTLAKQVWKRYHIETQMRLVTWNAYLIRCLMHGAAGISVVSSGQDGCSSGCAYRLIVKVGEYQAGFG